MKTLYEQHLEFFQQRKALNNQLRRSFRKFSIGAGSTGGLFISKAVDSKPIRDQINGIDMEAARFIIDSLNEIYGKENLDKINIKADIVFGDESDDSKAK